MTLFGFAVVLAGLRANDPLIWGCGLVLSLVGVVLFTHRQITQTNDESDASIDAKVVKFQAPASLVAIVVGLLLVLIGRGALTVGVSEDQWFGLPYTTTTAPPVVAPTMQTTAPPTTSPPPPYFPDAPPVDSLPHTGGETFVPLGIALVAGGRWILKP